jgi:hypothetical protein
MRAWIAPIAGLAGVIAGALGGYALPREPLPPTVLLATPDAASRPELLNQCRSMNDVAAATLPGQVHLVDFQTIWQKDFAPVTGFVVSYSNYDGEIYLGYIFVDGCIGSPIALSRSKRNPITGRP